MTTVFLPTRVAVLCSCRSTALMCADTCLSRRVHSGMTCQACVNRVEAALLSVSGVSAVSVDLASGVGFAPCFTLE